MNEGIALATIQASVTDACLGPTALRGLLGKLASHEGEAD